MKFEGKFEGREITPRAARIDVKYDALVRSDCGAVDAMILNVSCKGFRLHTAEELEKAIDEELAAMRARPPRGGGNVTGTTPRPRVGQAFVLRDCRGRRPHFRRGIHDSSKRLPSMRRSTAS